MVEVEKISTQNIPEFLMSDEEFKVYVNLRAGLRDTKDPVTVRTFLIDVERLLGVKNPEWEKVPKARWEDAKFLINDLTQGTKWEALNEEYLYALGVEDVNREPEDLELLIANGRHKAEPLWSKLTEYVDEIHPGQVGKFNPVGHYNDGQPRVAGPRRLFRHVDTFVVLGSTQTEKGGSLEIISHVGRLIRNVDFASKIDTLAIVMPFIGGSRGHREGQREDMLYEILEMISNPKIFGLALINARERAWWDRVGKEFVDLSPQGFLHTLVNSNMDELEALREGLLSKNIPMPEDLLRLKVISVDIHNNELPSRKFNEMGVEFINADVSAEIAEKTVEILTNKNMVEKSWLLEASDEGAIPRTEKSAMEILLKSGKSKIFVSHMIKTRMVAGVVEKVEMGKFEKWKLVDGEVVKTDLLEREKNDLFSEGLVLIKSDDMMDTGGTNKKDEKFLRERMRVDYSVTIATHPVFSKGTEILNDIGSDIYIFTNTLIHNGLINRDDVVIVDASPAIARALNIE